MDGTSGVRAGARWSDMDEKSALGSQLDSFREARRTSKRRCSRSPPRWTGAGSRSRPRCTAWSSRPAATSVLEGGGTARLGQVLSLELHEQLGAELTLPAGRRWRPGGPDGGPGPLRARRGPHRGRRHRAIPRRAGPSGRRIRRAGVAAAQRAARRAADAGRAGAGPRRALPGGRRRASTGTPSCAASPGRARPTRSA